jgi:N-succinyl-L-ornithine transcarbamylase
LKEPKQEVNKIDELKRTAAAFTVNLRFIPIKFNSLLLFVIALVNVGDKFSLNIVKGNGFPENNVLLQEKFNTMRTFTNVKDLGGLKAAVAEALEVKRNRFAYKSLGENKTLLMVFFNSSLRTRLSTQKAAMNLGMNTMVLDVNQGAWRLETERGVVMDGDKSEHLLEAIPVMGCYCDIIGVRSFARFESKADDYSENVLQQFIRYSGRPVFSMEGATTHPLQAFADLITIEEYKTKPRPKVVLSWAPHPKALPQAVPNSFADFMNEADVDFVITHPEGYELDPQFVRGAKIEYNQDKAFAGADFIYAKNWSAFADADYGQILSKDRSWTVDTAKMNLTDKAKFMHCLPVRRNMIVTDEVIESPQSIVIPEAANREIACEVILKRMLESLE